MNRTVSLFLYFRTSNGWRYIKPAVAANGKIKPWVGIVNGQEVRCPLARYFMRIGKQWVFAGNTSTDAVKAASTKEAELTIAANAVSPETPGKNSLKHLKTLFLQKYAHGSADTIALYTVVVTEFVDTCGKDFVEDIIDMDAINYCRRLEARGLSPRTRSNRYVTLRCFLRFCGIDPNVLIDKASHKKMKKFVQTEPETYTEAEINALISASNPYLALIWEFFYKTGFRDEELAFLEWSDINMIEQTVTIRSKPALGFSPKDAEERTVPLVAGLRDKLLAFQRTRKGTRFVFGTKSDKPNTKLLYALKRAARRAGLNCGMCHSCLKKNECEKILSSQISCFLSHASITKDRCSDCHALSRSF